MPRYYGTPSTRLIGYTYEADHHCISCTQKRLWEGRFTVPDRTDAEPGIDENGIPYRATDSEGNLVHPFFAGDEGPTDEDYNPMAIHCGDCHGEIRSA